MIRVGLTPAIKSDVVTGYCAAHPINKVIIFTPGKFDFQLRPDAPPNERVGWDDIIRYKFFYRLLREIDKRTLLVVNECLRTQDRGCLTYNCMRHYLQQSAHQIIFQHFPLIDSPDDFMILLDFDTRSRWRREPFSRERIGEFTNGVDLTTHLRAPVLRCISVESTKAERAAYQREKEKLFNELGLKDPHTIPRNLHLLSGRAKSRSVRPEGHYVARNNRLKLPNVVTYKEDVYPPERYMAFEFPHNFIDFSDFLCLTGRAELDALVCDLKADQWYFDRYTAWTGRVGDAIAALQR